MNRKIVWLCFITVLLLSTVFGTIWSNGFVRSASPTRKCVEWTVDDNKVEIPNAHFTTIQAALAYEEVSDCDTITVAPGTYKVEPGDYEGILISKSVTLRSMNVSARGDTIISGYEATQVIGDALIRITAPDVTITGFTIAHMIKGVGIQIAADRVRITQNKITNHPKCGIRVAKDVSEEIEITNNIFTKNILDNIDVWFECSDSNFSHNVIEGNWYPTSLEEPLGISIKSGRNNTIHNNSIKDCYCAIEISGSLSRNNTITENNISTCKIGMFVSSSESFFEFNEIRKCAIGMNCTYLKKAILLNNTLGQITNNAIQLSNASQCTVQFNTLEDISNDGISVSYNSTQCGVQYNTLEHISNDGIHVSQATNCAVQDNTLKHISIDGIHLSNTSQCTIKNNFIWNGNQSGISLINSDYATILGNTIYRCCHCGVHVYKGCKNYTIYHNDFFDNGFLVKGIQALDEACSGRFFNNTLKEGNYWSDFTGEDTDGDEIGDPVIAHHDLDPYPLVSPIARIGQIPVIRNETTLVGGRKEKIDYCSVLLGGYMTISMFHFDQEKKSITFNITLAKIIGDCNITVIVPKKLLNGAFEVCVDNIDIPCISRWKQNQNYYSICFDLFSLKSTQSIRIEAEANSPDCDINNDGCVDIFDVVTMAAHFIAES